MPAVSIQANSDSRLGKLVSADAACLVRDGNTIAVTGAGGGERTRFDPVVRLLRQMDRAHFIL